MIYAIPEIKGILASDYKSAYSTFESALKKVISEPNISVGCANSALESIIKHICEDPSIANCNAKDSLYALTQHLLKEFKFSPIKKLDKDIKQIGSSMLSIAKAIQDIRSKYTDATHGKTADDYIIDDPMYAKFLINAVTTIGLFLLNFYEKKYKPETEVIDIDEDIPF